MRRNPSQLRYSEDKLSDSSAGYQQNQNQNRNQVYPSVLESQHSTYSAPSNGGMSYAALSSTNRDDLEVVQSPFQAGNQPPNYNSHNPVYSSVIDDSTPHHAFFDLNAWDCLMQNFQPIGSNSGSASTPSAGVQVQHGGAGPGAVPSAIQGAVPGTLPGPSYGPI